MRILISKTQNLSDVIWTDTDELKTEARLTKGLQSFSDKPESDLFHLCYVLLLYQNHTKAANLGEFKSVFIQFQSKTE